MPPSVKLIDVAGITVEVTGADDAYGACVSARLGTVPADGAVEVRVAVVPAVSDVPSDPPHQQLEGFATWEHEGVTWISRGDTTVVVDGTSVAIGGPLDTPGGVDRFDDLLQFGVSLALASPERLLIHAAVIAKEGDALAIVGKSGQGKSTLAAAALLGDWELLGDDLALVHPSEGIVQAVQRAPMVPLEVAERHGLEGVVEKTARRRVTLPVETLVSDQRRLIGSISVRHGDVGSVMPVLASDVSVLDDALAVPPFRAVIRRHFRAGAAFVGLPAVSLEHALDLDQRIPRAQELLDEALRLCRDHQ